MNGPDFLRNAAIPIAIYIYIYIKKAGPTAGTDLERGAGAATCVGFEDLGHGSELLEQFFRIVPFSLDHRLSRASFAVMDFLLYRRCCVSKLRTAGELPPAPLGIIQTCSLADGFADLPWTGLEGASAAHRLDAQACAGPRQSRVRPAWPSDVL